MNCRRMPTRWFVGIAGAEVVAGLLVILGLLGVSGVAPQRANAVAVGDTPTLPVTANLTAGEQLVGWDVTITYDPAVVRPTGVNTLAWTALSTCYTTNSCAPGTLRIAAYSLTRCTVSPCHLFDVTWQALAPGDGALVVSAFQVSGSNNGAFQSRLTGATVGLAGLVVDSPTVTPLPPTATPTAVPSTPSPTATATTTATSTPTATNTPRPPPSPSPTATSTPTIAPTSTPTATKCRIQTGSGNTWTNGVLQPYGSGRICVVP